MPAVIKIYANKIIIHTQDFENKKMIKIIEYNLNSLKTNIMVFYLFFFFVRVIRILNLEISNSVLMNLLILFSFQTYLHTSKNTCG